MQLPATYAVLATLAAMAGTGPKSDPADTTEPASAASTAAASCPAYLGPECDTPAHQAWTTGQAIAELALDSE